VTDFLIENARLRFRLSPSRISQLQISNRERMAIFSGVEPLASSLQNPWPPSGVWLIVSPRLEFHTTATKQRLHRISNRYKTHSLHSRCLSGIRFLDSGRTRGKPLTQHIDLPSTYGLAWRAREVRLEPRSVPGVRRVLFSVAVISGVFLISLLASRPPTPKSAKAPESEFSAGRARAFLDKLVGDGVPHPTGSAANDAVRARIFEEFS